MEKTPKDVYHYVEFKNGKVGDLYTPDQLPARLAQIAQSETPPVLTEPTKPVTPPVTPVLPTVGAQSGEVGKPFSLTLPDFGTRIDVSDLPPGLYYDSSGQTIKGTPTKADTRKIKINSGTLGKLGEFVLTITGVSAPVVTPPAVTPPITTPEPPVIVTPTPDINAGNSIRPLPDVPIDEGDQAGDHETGFFNENNAQ